jgi:predicted metalloprotease with PDZ domain
MKISVILPLFFVCNVFAQTSYNYVIDLVNVQNDKVKVELTPPMFNTEQVEFCLPSMVPGTYEVYDFGKYISEFKAIGKNGSAISVIKKDQNTWQLSPANQIEKITYLVDDTWDKSELPNTTEKIVFEPGGTNIEVGTNFAINTHGFFGYFKNNTSNDFILNFIKPKGFYPATGLSDITFGPDKDVIRINDYHNLIDSPIMYSLPDTATVKVANTSVLIANYSPNKKINAKFIAKTLQELLYVQRDYLGGELPVNKYAFLFYYIDRPTLSGSHGALEHSYSSFYVLPETDSLDAVQTIRDVAAHEFFHIVTPLNIHATQIGDFDFNNPQMSEHLWLYEGMTEYAAQHAQAKGGLMNVDQLLNVMMNKYTNSIENYNDTMPFTYMSKHVLEPKIHKQYNNVYEKGAVIGMCLDILLRDLSKGRYGTQNLMKDLSTKYGKDKSFKDEDLFNDIEKFTYPEVGVFLRKYVGGNSPLPMEEILKKIGIQFVKEREVDEFTLGGADFDYNPETQRLFVTNVGAMDAFGKKLKYKMGDQLTKFNGKEIKINEFREVIQQYFETVKEGDVVTIDVVRGKKLKQKTLKAKAKKVRSKLYNQIVVIENMSDTQKQNLKNWVGL